MCIGTTADRSKYAPSALEVARSSLSYGAAVESAAWHALECQGDVT